MKEDLSIKCFLQFIKLMTGNAFSLKKIMEFLGVQPHTGELRLTAEIQKSAFIPRTVEKKKCHTLRRVEHFHYQATYVWFHADLVLDKTLD